MECVEALLERGADPLMRTRAGGQVQSRLYTCICSLKRHIYIYIYIYIHIYIEREREREGQSARARERERERERDARVVRTDPLVRTRHGGQVHTHVLLLVHDSHKGKDKVADS